ncbi:MAG: zf-HC2 domain-containing protein [Blastocatellia bacterium]|nr:zf-HC2 domain-containing protein [Blastocatellia bacterium]
MDCPGFERLIDYLDGLLDAASSEVMAAHLDSGCSECVTGRDWYEMVISIAASDDTVEPPPWVLKRAIRIFENARPQESAPARIRRLVASLIFDSLARPSMAGARLMEPDDHQLLYRAGDYHIDLQLAQARKCIHSADASFDLTGQILKESEYAFESVAGLRLALIRDDETVHSTITNEIGGFSFPAVEGGFYEMRIEAGEITITIAALNIL